MTYAFKSRVRAELTHTSNVHLPHRSAPHLGKLQGKAVVSGGKPSDRGVHPLQLRKSAPRRDLTILQRRRPHRGAKTRHRKAAVETGRGTVDKRRDLPTPLRPAKC